MMFRKLSNLKLTKIVALGVLFIASTSYVAAQCGSSCGPNVVNNSSFETSTANCVTLNSEMFTDYTQVQDWIGTACITCPGNGSTPDYYNSSCTGAAATEGCGFGTGSVGFFTSVDVGGTGGTNSREYVQTQLNTTLVAGQEYCATIQVKTNPTSFAYVPSDGLGLWFTNSMVDIDVDNGGQQYLGPGSIVNATPQIANPAGNIIDTICTTITGTFVATGTEDWLVIGNFRPDNLMQTNASCGGLFVFCFGYLIVDQIDVVPVCSTCDATISAAGPFCESDPALNLIAVDGGGTWTGTGITDANLGTFEPSTAGPGVHTITYTLLCGDTDTEDITVNADDDPSFTYAQGSYCLTDSDPTPNITGLSGGTFTIDGTGVINTTTGQIDIPGSGAGSYIITYTTNGPCPQSTTFNVTLTAAADATITTAGPFCETDAATNLAAVDAGGTWTGTGITDANLGTFNPVVAGPGSHSITYTINGSCGDTDNITVDVNATDDAIFSYPQASFCISDSDPTPTISGLSGGTFSIDGTGVINPSSGIIDLDISGQGAFLITYLTNGPCPSSSTFNLTITNMLDATITPAGPFCENDAALNLTAVDGGGIWTGTGITDANLGTFDPSIAGAGTHNISYTITGACGSTDAITITVNPSDIATFSYPAVTYCSLGLDPLATITGTVGGVFIIDNSGVIDSNTGELDLDASGTGTYIITYTTAGSCPASATFTITISDGSNAIITGAGPFCSGSAALDLISSPAGGTWSGTGLTDPVTGTFDPSIAGVGTHQIVYAITGACGDSDTIDIIVNQTPTAVLQSSYSVNYGSSVTLNASGGTTYSWSPATDLDCSNCASPIASPLTTTTYCVTVTNANCSDTACTIVNVNLDFDCGAAQVPTAFSPSSGDVNSTECVLGGCFTSMHFRIYDRWGELVFESFDQNDCWDGTHLRNGKAMSTGVYVYILQGEMLSGESIDQNGNITLIR